MPLLVQRTFSASNKELRKSEPADAQAKQGLPSARKLSFSLSAKVQEIPHLHDLSPEEIAATWYNAIEMRLIKDDAVQVIKRTFTNTMEKDDCMRGLEHRIPEASRQRKENKRKAFMIVWETQEDQWEDGVTDNDAMSIKYQMQTMNSREAALELGMQDEKEAKKALSKLATKKGFLSKLKR